MIEPLINIWLERVGIIFILINKLKRIGATFREVRIERF